MAAKPVEYNGTIIKRQDLTDKLSIFRVKPDTPAEPFIPGQYVVLGLNHEEKGGVMRAYSIASPPHLAPEFLEFYIRYVNEPTSENPMTHLLFDRKEGDRIMVQNKIRGKFTVEETCGVEDPRLKVFVASGTGLAPFTSIVFEHHKRHGNAGNHVILHGASYTSDLGYVDELESVMNAGPAKRYLGTISRPKEEANWKGLAGRVETHFEPSRLADLEKALGLPEGGFNPQNVVVLICGLQGTIANTLTSLLHRGFVPGDRGVRRALGVPEEVAASLFYEQYDTTPIIDRKDGALINELAGRLRKAGVPLLEKVASE